MYNIYDRDNKRYSMGRKEYNYPKEIGGIYAIVCLPNRKIYIGKATNLEKKIKRYRDWMAAKKIPNKKELTEDVIKYGASNFVMDVITYCDEFNLNLLERYFINKYRAIEFGYNNINGSATIKSKTYELNMENSFCKELIELNYFISKLIYNIFHFDKFENYCVIKFSQIELLYDVYFNEYYKDYSRWAVSEIIKKLDLTIYYKNPKKDYYIMFNGNNIKDIVSHNYIYVDIDTDKKEELEYFQLTGNLFNPEEFFIVCPKLREEVAIKLEVELEKDFIKNKKIIDLSYKRYKFLDNITLVKN